MENSVHSAHFNFYLKWKCEKMKKVQQNIQIDRENIVSNLRCKNHVKFCFCYTILKRIEEKKSSI